MEFKSANMNPYLITAAVSYLLGSIPFGCLLVRIFTGKDVRASGSGNIGATNVARQSPALGVATLMLDAAKGLAAVLMAQILSSGPHQQLIMTTAAFFAVLGHLFPVWLKFRGGKGVATSLGASLLLTPKSILCMVVLFLIICRRLPLCFAWIGRGGGCISVAGLGIPRIQRRATTGLDRPGFGAGHLEAPAKYRAYRRRNGIEISDVR